MEINKIMKTFRLLFLPIFTLLCIPGFSQNETAIRYEIENERYRSADIMITSALQSDPGNGTLYYMQGYISMLLGDTMKASASFTNGKDAKSESWSNIVGLGWVALAENDPTNAQKSFETALALAGPKNAQYYYQLAVAYFKIEKPDADKALSAVEKSLSIKPVQLDAFLLKGDILITKPDGGGKALTAYEDAESKFKENPAPEVRIARLYMNARNYPLAMDYINKAIEKDPNYSPAYKLKGDYQFNLKKYEDARYSYEKALTLSDSTDQLLTQYLYACFLAKDYAISYELSSKLKGSAINPFVLNRTEAYSLYEIGKYPESLESIQRLFSKGSSDRLIRQDYLYYGKILSKNKQDSLAIGYFEQAWEADSSDTDALVEMSKSYSNLGDYEKSAETYKRKIEAAPPIALDYFLMGRSYYYAKIYEKADSAFAMVASMQPSAYHGFFWRGRCNAVLDPDLKSDSAKVFYEQAEALASADPVKNKKDLIEMYQYLAFYYVKKDNPSKASDYYKKILELDPENKDAKTNLNLLNKK